MKRGGSFGRGVSSVGELIEERGHVGIAVWTVIPARA